MDIKDMVNELLIKIDYLRNYNEVLDMELDKIDGKVKIGHFRCLTHSLEEEINTVDDIAANIFKKLHNKNED